MTHTHIFPQNGYLSRNTDCCSTHRSHFIAASSAFFFVLFCSGSILSRRKTTKQFRWWAPPNRTNCAGLWGVDKIISPSIYHSVIFSYRRPPPPGNQSIRSSENENERKTKIVMNINCEQIGMRGSVLAFENPASPYSAASTRAMCLPFYIGYIADRNGNRILKSIKLKIHLHCHSYGRCVMPGIADFAFAVRSTCPPFSCHFIYIYSQFHQ